MSKENDGGPVHRNLSEMREEIDANGVHHIIAVTVPGISLRDAFAIAALQGFLGNRSIIDTAGDRELSWLAERVFKMADAMLKAREE